MDMLIWHQQCMPVSIAPSFLQHQLLPSYVFIVNLIDCSFPQTCPIGRVISDSRSEEGRCFVFGERGHSIVPGTQLRQ